MSIVCGASKLISEISSESCSLDEIFIKDSENRNKIFKILNLKSSNQSPNYHIFCSTIANSIITRNREEVDSDMLRAILDALISGLTAIESETISLSGSSIIKLIQWDHTGEVSRILADNDDFVAILIADLCAMFSKIEESGSAPFIRIVRFCELLIDVSRFESCLPEKMISSLHTEFITRILRTTISSTGNINSILNWCNELLKACHRGNEFVIPIVNEVFSKMRLLSIINNKDFIEILGNERSRRIENLVRLLFNPSEDSSDVKVIKPSCQVDSNFVATDDVFRSKLVITLESFEKYKIATSKNNSKIDSNFSNLLECNRNILFNWYPYFSKILVVELDDSADAELKMLVDIFSKVSAYLNL